MASALSAPGLWLPLLSLLLVAKRGFVAVAAARAPGASQERPPVARLLVEELFLGMDPMLAEAEELLERPADEAMTHVSSRDIDMVLEFAPQPVTLYVELGAYEGGSAILAARRAAKRAAEKGEEEHEATSILAVDTFLGDLRVLWERPAKERRELLRPDGSISLYERFRANVQHAGQAHAVLPLPATSVVALRLLDALARRGVAPRPQVIYLDSAHEEGEVLLELSLAWEAVAPGGIIFGDDWILGGREGSGGHGDSGPVQRDVLRFAEAHGEELDDGFGPRVQPMRTLGRARPGLFVSYLSFQWFMRKRPDVPEQRAPGARSAKTGSAEEVSAGFDCWSGGFDGSDCCDVDRHGPEGNRGCWDIVFTFQQCCKGWGQVRPA